MSIPQDMPSQWDCFLKNVGTWKGSFTRLSSDGQKIKDTPTIVTFELSQNSQAVHQVVEYLPVDEPSSEVAIDYTPTSFSRSILFFENGAFCQGSMQWSPYSQFGGEFGLINSDRRLRMVQLYNESSKLERVVLIREKLPDSNTPERPHLKIEDLLGEWQGEAVTMYPDFRNPEKLTTHLKITRQDNNTIQQTLSFGNYQITSNAVVDGSRLLFKNSPLPVQVLMLPDGASCNCPLEINLGHNFVLEMGWLLQPNKRQRIIRNFDTQGRWTSCTLVTETRISN